MPFIYTIHPKQVPLENLTTNGTGNTESEQTFLKPGASRAAILLAFFIQGKAAAATTLSGIVLRLKQWTTTAGSGGTSVTPAPKHNLAPAAVATAGIATTAAGVVTTGTGGPNLVGLASCGVSGPGGWASKNQDDVPTLDGGANKSMDLFSSSPTVSLNYEFAQDHQEC